MAINFKMQEVFYSHAIKLNAIRILPAIALQNINIIVTFKIH